MTNNNIHTKSRGFGKIKIHQCDGLYNSLLLSVASIATLGTFASSFCYSFNIKTIQKIGKFGKKGYKRIKYNQPTKSGITRIRSLEWHTHLHKGHYHWQLNKWDGIIRKGAAGRWKWWLGSL